MLPRKVVLMTLLQQDQLMSLRLLSHGQHSNVIGADVSMFSSVIDMTLPQLTSLVIKIHYSSALSL
jgi:hypothetical protein